jgi:hypothetical protein
MPKQFNDMTLQEKINHIRKSQQLALEEIRKGAPSNLIDITDHIDVYGLWLCDIVEAQQELVADILSLANEIDNASIKYRTRLNKDIEF